MSYQPKIIQLFSVIYALNAITCELIINGVTSELKVFGVTYERENKIRNSYEKLRKYRIYFIFILCI